MSTTATEFFGSKFFLGKYLTNSFILIFLSDFCYQLNYCKAIHNHTTIKANLIYDAL